MKNWILELLKSEKSIFSVDELSIYIDHKNEQYLRNRISNYTKQWVLKIIARWFYSTKDKYDKFELANRIYSPSYISFFSALYYHQIIFQFQNEIYLAYIRSGNKKINDSEIILKYLKKDILLNLEGIITEKNYSIASPERAFLDTLYIFWEIYFDNLDKISKDNVDKILPIYNSKRLEKLANSYFLKK